MLAHLGWRELLRRWSGEAISHAGAVGLEVTPQMRASGWIGTPPASAADIATVQARLERSLPPSYRAFLAITDGWPVLSFDFGRVRPVAELDWVASASPGLYEAVCAGHGYEWPPDSDDGPPLMNRALLPGTGTDGFLYDTGSMTLAALMRTANGRPPAGRAGTREPGTSSRRSARAWSRTTRASSPSRRPTASRTQTWRPRQGMPAGGRFAATAAGRRSSRRPGASATRAPTPLSRSSAC